MRLKIGIACEFAGADSGAIDHQIESWIDIFEFFKANVRFDLAAGFLKSVGEIIEIDDGVH